MESRAAMPVRGNATFVLDLRFKLLRRRMALVWARARLGRDGMMRRPGLPLVLVSLALLAAGCRVPGAPSAQAAGNQQLTVAVVPGFGNAPLLVGGKDGLFARHGLTVTVQTYGTMQQAYAALASGQA